MIDLTGKRFGRLTAVEPVRVPYKDKFVFHWKCVCDCGKQTVSNAVEQARNKRSNFRITLNGKTKALSEHVEEQGQHYGRVYARLQRGWTPEKAFAQ